MAWFEDFHTVYDHAHPNAAQYEQDLSNGVTAGDNLSITVSYPSVVSVTYPYLTNTPTMHYIIKNLTKGWTVDETYPDPEGLYPQGSAEAISERVCSGGKNVPCPPYLPMPQPNNRTTSFSGLNYSANAFDIQFPNQALNDVFLPNECYGEMEQSVDCADPFPVNTNPDHCDAQLGQTQDVNDGVVNYVYFDPPNTPTSLPTQCSLP